MAQEGWVPICAVLGPSWREVLVLPRAGNVHGQGLVLTGVERHVSIHGCECVSSFDVCINREPLGESATGEDFLQALIPHSICCSREHAFGRGHPDISATVRACGTTRRGHALPVACVARCRIGTRDRCASTSNKILVCTTRRRSRPARCHPHPRIIRPPTLQILFYSHPPPLPTFRTRRSRRRR